MASLSSQSVLPACAYPDPVKDRSARDWEELAQREPYFAVLTKDGLPDVESNTRASAAFFETGEEDIAALLAAIASLLGRAIPLGSSLDFGCGAGRLTLPLARRATNVVACDISATILDHARRNAEDAGLSNIAFMLSDDLARLPDGRFDFVCSLLVLQHIAPLAGYEIIRTLLRLLAPAGIAALHLTLERPGGALRRLARATSRRPHAGRASQGESIDADSNAYDERSVHRLILAAGAHELGRFPTRQGKDTGAVLVIQKPRATV